MITIGVDKEDRIAVTILNDEFNPILTELLPIPAARVLSHTLSELIAALDKEKNT